MKTHGKSKTVEYRTWHRMLKRCGNPRDKRYAYYGGRGIAVCDRWRNSFEAFLADMGPKPSPKHSIERKRNSGNYEPSNCVWATAKVQNRNTRRNHFLTHAGITLCIGEWAERLGIKARAINVRLSRGWTVDEALSADVSRTTRKRAAVVDRLAIRLTFRGQTMLAAQWARELGINRHTLEGRLRRGWPVERALTA